MTSRFPLIPEPIRAARLEVTRLQARLDGILAGGQHVTDAELGANPSLADMLAAWSRPAAALPLLRGDRLAEYRRYEAEYAKAVKHYNALVEAHNAEVQARKDARAAAAERKAIRAQMCPTCFTVHAGECL